MPDKAKAKINGKYVDIEVISPEEWEEMSHKERDSIRSFLSNPDVQKTVLFFAGTGMGIYRGVRGVLGNIPNPMGKRLKKALPWATASILGLVLAPSLGKTKNVIRVLAGAAGVKAAYELVMSGQSVTTQQVEV